mmetsp:Transcript_62831/g.113099  ORF Transcript_62831/g.113099 Transcript_62831/m.113099 type:complete len:222 (+) Transcript_62831:389-1054(+)
MSRTSAHEIRVIGNSRMLFAGKYGTVPYMLAAYSRRKTGLSDGNCNSSGWELPSIDPIIIWQIAPKCDCIPWGVLLFWPIPANMQAKTTHDGIDSESSHQISPITHGCLQLATDQNSKLGAKRFALQGLQRRPRSSASSSHLLDPGQNAAVFDSSPALRELPKVLHAHNLDLKEDVVCRIEMSGNWPPSLLHVRYKLSRRSKVDHPTFCQADDLLKRLENL